MKEGITQTRTGSAEVLKIGPQRLVNSGTCYSFDCQLTFLHKRKGREQGYKDINCSDILSNEELPLSKSTPAPGALL